MTLKELKETLFEQGFENSVIFENPSYETAVIGCDENGRIIYDYEKMIQYLIDTDGMTYEDAMEFIDYNTIRALPYAGDMKPIIKYDLI